MVPYYRPVSGFGGWMRRQMANIITTTRTYKTMDNALQALDRACERLGVKRDYFRYLVAVSPIDGRFAPTVLLGGDNMHWALPLVNCGIMVIS
jgi:hypothetical protein